MNDPSVVQTSGLPLGRRERLVILGFWLALGLLESAKGVVGGRLSGLTVDWPTALVGNLPWWLLWAAITPAAIAVARRFRFDRGWASALPAHAVASIAVALAHHVVAGSLYYLTHTRGMTVPFGGALTPMTWAIQLRVFFSSYFVVNVLTYWAIVGGYYALEFYTRYREGELRAARLEAHMHRARLDALRMELNPHFLFNTLNAISGLVRRREHEDAVRMLARLGDLLRETLEGGRETEVPLARELDLLRLYLEIERIRFGDRLAVEMAVDPETVTARVPPLLLQPLVENAARHGIARARRGCITIGARRCDGHLELWVEDTGSGLDDGSDRAPGGESGERGERGERSWNRAREHAGAALRDVRTRRGLRDHDAGRGRRARHDPPSLPAGGGVREP